MRVFTISNDSLQPDGSNGKFTEPAIVMFIIVAPTSSPASVARIDGFN
jgi:hypothetical protein